MAACEVTVLPSEMEAFGRVLAESWSVGVPTVAAAVGGCEEITRASGGGLLVPVGDSGLLSQSLAELLGSPSLARELGDRGREWVARKCSPVVYSHRLENILANVVRQKERSAVENQCSLYDKER